MDDIFSAATELHSAGWESGVIDSGRGLKMTIGDALTFIKRSLSDSDLRSRLNGAENKEEIEKILADELLSFNPNEFEDAYNHKLTECQEEEDADQLKELKMWWDLLGQVLDPSACKSGCSGCC